jgi:hypothetical protein
VTGNAEEQHAMKIRRLVAGAVFAAGAFAPAMASADPYTDTPPDVEAVEVSRHDPAVLGTVETRSESTLPVTGGDLGALTAIGVIAIAGGTVLVRRSRLRPATARVETA